MIWDFIDSRKKNKIIITSILSCMLVFLIMFSSQYDAEISFSKESGYYNDAFELKIVGGEVVIVFIIRWMAVNRD